MDILQNLSGFQWAIVAAAGVALLLIWKGGDVLAWAQKPRPTTTTVAVESSDPDVADMVALKRLTARFAAMKCKEGIAAMRTAAEHFFHSTEAA